MSSYAGSSYIQVNTIQTHLYWDINCPGRSSKLAVYLKSHFGCNRLYIVSDYILVNYHLRGNCHVNTAFLLDGTVNKQHIVGFMSQLLSQLQVTTFHDLDIPVSIWLVVWDHHQNQFGVASYYCIFQGLHIDCNVVTIDFPVMRLWQS